MDISRDVYRAGRLTTKANTTEPDHEAKAGMHVFKLKSKKENLFYIPEHYTHQQPASMALMLHGAGGHAEHGMWLLKEYADEHNMILAAPASQSYTWDIIADDAFGPDVILIDSALYHLFENYNIDTKHIAIGGFSDGASYALCIGLSNGDLFTHIIAFSPGFAYTAENTGKPGVFISHGVHDRVLPINPCSRRIVPQLQRKGLHVHYEEFDGEHEIPPHISQTAVDWLLKKS